MVLRTQKTLHTDLRTCKVKKSFFEDYKGFFICCVDYKTVSNLFCMDATILSVRVFGIMFHSSNSATTKSRTMNRGIYLIAMLRPSVTRQVQSDLTEEYMRPIHIVYCLLSNNIMHSPSYITHYQAL